MELTLIRHFQTPGNGKKQYIGSTDEPLDEAMIPKNLIAYPQIDVLCVSPMLRCRQTAELIYKDQPQMVCDKLRELDFGAYEGKTYEELKDEPAYQKWLASGGLGAFPGGEDRKDFKERCIEGLESLVDRWILEGQKHAGIVVHGGTIMVLMYAYADEKKGFYDWQVRNGEGFSFRIDVEKWKRGERCFEQIKALRYEKKDTKQSEEFLR